MTHPGTPSSESTLRRIPPHLVHPPADNRKHTPQKRERLRASIALLGQLVAGQVRDHPEKPGEYICVGGAGRLECCLELEIDFLAQYLPGVPTPEDVIAKRLTEDLIREAMSPPDLAADFNRLMKLWDCTAATLSERLNIPESTISRVRSIKRLCPTLIPLVEDFTLCPSVAYVIAGVPSLEKQRQLAKEAIDGDLTRDQVYLRAKPMKGVKKGRKPTTLKGKINGREFTIILQSDDKGDDLIAIGEELAKRATKYKGAPATTLSFLFV